MSNAKIGIFGDFAPIFNLKKTAFRTKTRILNNIQPFFAFIL